ncbi:MAG: hypothetical protein MUF42_16805 [Cytophagaceae bacterium]|nr:hypothetical protein [Cytophagaceae bacterium]
MKHTRLIFLLSFLVMRLYGQTDLASIALNGKPTDVITSRDQKGNVFFLFQYGKSYEMVLLDSSYKETKRVNIKRAEDDSKKNSLVGTIFDERGAVAYLMNAKTNEFFAMKIDRQTGSMEFNSLGKLANEEYFLKGIELDGKFHVLAVPKQENQINLYTSDYGNPFTIQKYPIDFSSLYQKLSFKNEELNQRNESPVGIDYLRYDQEHSVKSAHSKKKLYTFQGNIYLIFDEATCTHVIRIRPDAGTSS